MSKIGRPGLPEETRQKIKDLWRNGFSYTQISETVAVPPGSIYTLLKPTGRIHTKAPKQRQGSLTFLEREEISRQLATGQTIRAIDAEDRAFYKSRRPQKMKLAVNPLLREYVLSKLQKYWSPEQISNRLLIDYPNNLNMRISGEAIYRSVYLNYVHKIFPNKIHQNFRRQKPIRQPKNNSVRGQWRSQVKNAKSIRERPETASKFKTPLEAEKEDLLP